MDCVFGPIAAEPSLGTDQVLPTCVAHPRTVGLTGDRQLGKRQGIARATSLVD